MERSESLVELTKALSRFQGAMHSVPKGSVNPYFHSKYADLDAVWDACRKPLTENGLALVQTTLQDTDKLFLETLLLHTSGEYLCSRYPLFPMKQTKETGWVQSDDPQSIGSAITYARRYAMSAMLGVSADEDDDAENAQGRTGAAAPVPVQAPRGLCPVHGVPFIERKAGVAKATGRPYPAFWTCPTRGCKEKPQEPKATPIQPTEEELGFGHGGAIIDPDTLPWEERPLTDMEIAEGAIHSPSRRPQEPRNDGPTPAGDPIPDLTTLDAFWKRVRANGFTPGQVHPLFDGDLPTWIEAKRGTLDEAWVKVWDKLRK